MMSVSERERTNLAALEVFHVLHKCWLVLFKVIPTNVLLFFLPHDVEETILLVS